jgi:DNA-directed RNA polymerase subunit RPC12/RpoP
MCFNCGSGDFMNKATLTITGYVKCPVCGQSLLIPDGVNDYFVCADNYFPQGISCNNTKKYKIPTIELEEL